MSLIVLALMTAEVRAQFGDYPDGRDDPHFISRTLILDKDDRVFLNADHLSNEGHLTVELLDEQFRPLKGFSGQDSAVLKESGLRQPVLWHDRGQLKGFEKPVRIRVNWAGQDSRNVRVHAVYVSPQ